MEEGHVLGVYEALADIIIVSVQPLGSTVTGNFDCRRGGFSNQLVYQENNMTSWRALDCDRGAREPKTLQEFCASYLPSSWALVVQGLTVAASALDSLEGHQVHRIVVLENDPDREAYIRRQLTATHDVGSEDVQGGARVVEEGTGVGVEEVHIRRAQSEGNFDDNEAEEGEEDSSSGEEDFGGGAEGDMGDSRDLATMDPLGI